MTLFLSLLSFFFGVFAWIPFLNNIYSQDYAVNVYCVDQSRKKKMVLYKDSPNASIGHFFHVFFMQMFWDKFNTKAFYWILCIYTSLTAVTLFSVVNMIAGPLPAIISSLLYSFYIVNPRLDGNWGAFEQLIPLPLLLSILCILSASGKYSLLLFMVSGMCGGYAILIKQIAALYIPGLLVMLADHGYSFYHFAFFILGVIIINLAPLLYYGLRYHAFWEYLISTWLFQLPTALNPKKYNKYYPRMNVRGVKSSRDKKNIFIHNLRSTPFVVFLAFIGIMLSVLYHPTYMTLGILFCLICSVLMIFMRGTFFPHYFLNPIPWLSIFAGIGFAEITAEVIEYGLFEGVALASILAISLLAIDAYRVDKIYYAVSNNPYDFLTRVWGKTIANNYKVQAEIGNYIKHSTAPDDKILLCGWAPHILLHAERAHFTDELCLYTEDYLEMFHRKNPSYYRFLERIFSFNQIKNLHYKNNPFHQDHPKVIVFGSGTVNIEGFEHLTGIEYVYDSCAKGYPLFRADSELTDLLSPYKSRYHQSSDSENELNIDPRVVDNWITHESFHEAYTAIKQMLKIHPQHRIFLMQLCDVLIHMKKYDLLFNFVKRVVEKDMISNLLKLSLLNKVAESFSIQNRYVDAEKTIQDILNIDPGNVTALNNLGVVRYHQDKKDEAIGFFRKVLTLDPGNEDAGSNLAALS